MNVYDWKDEYDTGTLAVQVSLKAEVSARYQQFVSRSRHMLIVLRLKVRKKIMLFFIAFIDQFANIYKYYRYSIV